LRFGVLLELGILFQLISTQGHVITPSAKAIEAHSEKKREISTFSISPSIPVPTCFCFALLFFNQLIFLPILKYCIRKGRRKRHNSPKLPQLFVACLRRFLPLPIKISCVRSRRLPGYFDNGEMRRPRYLSRKKDHMAKATFFVSCSCHLSYLLQPSVTQPILTFPTRLHFVLD
jgi:hypothetical protein